jgi:hypothetical protein
MGTFFCMRQVGDHSDGLISVRSNTGGSSFVQRDSNGGFFHSTRIVTGTVPGAQYVLDREDVTSGTITTTLDPGVESFTLSASSGTRTIELDCDNLEAYVNKIYHVYHDQVGNLNRHKLAFTGTCPSEYAWDDYCSQELVFGGGVGRGVTFFVGKSSIVILGDYKAERNTVATLVTTTPYLLETDPLQQHYIINGTTPLTVRLRCNAMDTPEYHNKHYCVHSNDAVAHTLDFSGFPCPALWDWDDSGSGTATFPGTAAGEGICFWINEYSISVTSNKGPVVFS